MFCLVMNNSLNFFILKTGFLMLLIKTKLDLSKIHGVGLFADEFIAKGTKIWEYRPNFDKAFTEEDLEELGELTREFVNTYAFKHKGKYYLCADNDRFFNHSDSCNCDAMPNEENELPGATIALRDIHPGEELTCNYSIWECYKESNF